MSYSPAFIRNFLTKSSLLKKIITALACVFLAFGILAAWTIYLFNRDLKKVNEQIASSDYLDALRKVYQGIKLQEYRDEAPQRLYVQDALGHLIAIDKDVGTLFGTDEETLQRRRPGVGTPASILHQWQQVNATADSDTKKQLSEDIQNQLAILHRYVLDSYPADNPASALYFRIQNLLDPQNTPKQSEKLYNELSLDIQTAGLPPLSELKPPKKIKGLKDITQLFVFWEELSRQSKHLLEMRKDELLSFYRQFVLGIILLATALLALGMYLLKSIYKPLVSLLDAENRFIGGEADQENAGTMNEIGQIRSLFNKLGGIIGQILRGLDETNVLLKTSTHDVASTMERQEESAQEQERITRQIAVTVFDISENSKELSETMNEINVAASAASGLAQAGRNHLLQLEILMQGLIGASNHLVAILTDLNARTRHISTVISVMVHVADETNMLSLNTSLEAAKAKEVGKGFAIIADEIRRLADQTAAATLAIEQVVKDILEMMDQSLQEVQSISDNILSSVDTASDVQRHFNEIIDKVQYLSGKFNAVATGMRQQMKSAQSIDSSIQLLKMITHDSSRSIKQFQQVIGELDSSIQQLNQAKMLIQNRSMKEVTTEN